MCARIETSNLITVGLKNCQIDLDGRSDSLVISVASRVLPARHVTSYQRIWDAIDEQTLEFWKLRFELYPKFSFCKQIASDLQFKIRCGVQFTLAYNWIACGESCHFVLLSVHKIPLKAYAMERYSS